MKGTHRKTGGDEKTHITVDGNERSIGKAIVAQRKIVKNAVQQHPGRHKRSHRNRRPSKQKVPCEKCFHAPRDRLRHNRARSHRHRSFRPTRRGHRTAIGMTHFVAGAQFDARHIGQTINFLCTTLTTHRHRFTMVDAHNTTTQFFTIAKVDHIGIKALSRGRECKPQSRANRRKIFFIVIYKLNRNSKLKQSAMRFLLYLSCQKR